MTDDTATNDSATGEIGGPVFLPLRRHPSTARNQAPASDNTADERRAKVTGRDRRPAGDRLYFAPSR